MRTAQHVPLPWPFQLVHETADKWMKLVIRGVALRQAHVLLVNQEERTMQLVARGVIDPLRSLTIGSSMIRIGLPSETSRCIHQISLECWFPLQGLVEKKPAKKIAHPLRKRGGCRVR